MLWVNVREYEPPWFVTVRVATRSSSPVFSVQERTTVLELDDPEDGVTESQLSLETMLQLPTEVTSMNWLPLS